jgi:hypothetical protein
LVGDNSNAGESIEDPEVSGVGAGADGNSTDEPDGEQLLHPNSASTPAAKPADWDVDARRVWLKNFEEDLEGQRSYRTGELTRLDRRETAVFVVFVLAAIVGILLAPAGLVLIFLGKAVTGIISGIAGILSGSGSFLLRLLNSNIEAQRAELRKQEREERRTKHFLTAAILTSDDEQRTHLMSEFAAMQIDLIGHEAGYLTSKDSVVARSRRKRKPS